MLIMYFGLEWGFGNMPQGLQCWDASGNLVLDVTDRLTRVLGTFNTGTTDGSITDPALTTGTPWYVSIGFDNYFYYGEMGCIITVVGSTLSWTFQSGTKSDKKIMYGVY